MNLKHQNNWPLGVSALDALNDYKWQRHLAEKTLFKIDDYRPILQLSEFVWMYVLWYESFLTIFSL